MKLFLIGGVIGLVIGVVLTVLYFSLATFFEVNAKALHAKGLKEKAIDEKAVDAIRKAAGVGNKNAEDVSAIDKPKAG